jgi:O-antigen ligase
MKTKLINSLLIVFLLLGLIPLLPFYIKPIGIIAALALGIVVVIYKKGITFSFFFFNNILLFILYVVSCFYSDDKQYALKYIETSLPFILFPVFFLFISKLEISKQKWKQLENIFYNVYFIASTIYAIMIFAYIYHLGYFSGEVTYDLCISWLRAYFWGFQNHPIYASLFLGIAILFAIKLIIKSEKQRLWYVLGSLIIILALLFLSRKGIIIALIPTSFFLFFKLNQHTKIKNIFIIINIASVLTLVFIFPNSFERFKKINKIELNQPIDMKNSTSIRLGIYNCAFSQVQYAGFFGFGIGDVKDKLNNCYKVSAKPLVGQNLNTHNAYLNVWLSLGFIGLLIFAFFLYKLLLLAIINNDYLFLTILIFYALIFLFENILDRQNGVLLFAFLINFYTFKHIVISKNTSEK